PLSGPGGSGAAALSLLITKHLIFALRPWSEAPQGRRARSPCAKGLAAPTMPPKESFAVQHGRIVPLDWYHRKMGQFLVKPVSRLKPPVRAEARVGTFACVAASGTS